MYCIHGPCTQPHSQLQVVLKHGNATLKSWEWAYSWGRGQDRSIIILLYLNPHNGGRSDCYSIAVLYHTTLSPEGSNMQQAMYMYVHGVCVWLLEFWEFRVEGNVEFVGNLHTIVYTDSFQLQHMCAYG